MPHPDTIVACATSPRSGRALVRVSGPAAPEVLARCLFPAAEAPDARVAAQRAPEHPDRADAPGPQHPGGPEGKPEPRAEFTRGVCVVRVPIDPVDPRAHPGNVLVPAIAIRAPAPRSYTGEHTLELLFVGPASLTERIVRAIAGLPGCRVAHPGEFTARAHANDRLTLEQAEGVAALIAARTDAELRAAHELTSGSAGDEYRAWTDEIASVLALVEAGIDFSDQEGIVAISAADVRRRSESVAEQIERRLGGSRGSKGEAGPETAKVVIVGRPNTGKSTLFNALVGHARAVESGVAGTTRDVLRERVRVGAAGGEIELIDLAGLDEAMTGRENNAETSIERMAQEQAAGAVEAADAMIFCDPTGRFEVPARVAGALARALQESPPGVLFVRTMGDLVRTGASEGPAAAGLIGSGRSAGGVGGALGGREASHERDGAGSEKAGMVTVCARDALSLSPVRAFLAQAAARAWRGQERAGVIPRHRSALEACAAALRAGADSAREENGSAGNGMRGGGVEGLRTPEATASHLREALGRIGLVTGRTTPDDVLGRIFASFCIGK